MSNKQTFLRDGKWLTISQIKKYNKEESLDEEEPKKNKSNKSNK